MKFVNSFSATVLMLNPIQSSKIVSLKESSKIYMKNAVTAESTTLLMICCRQLIEAIKGSTVLRFINCCA